MRVDRREDLNACSGYPACWVCNHMYVRTLSACKKLGSFNPWVRMWDRRQSGGYTRAGQRVDEQRSAGSGMHGASLRRAQHEGER